MFFLVVTALMSGIGLYLGLRLIWPLPLSRGARLVLCVLLLICANKFALQFWLAPGGVLLKLSYEILIVAAWLHISVVLMFFACLAADVLGLALRWTGARLFTPVSRLAAIGLFGALLAGVGIRNALDLPRVEEIRVPVRQAPADLDGFRIALLADLHLGPLFGEAWMREVVRLTNEARPDLIAVAGDVADDTPENLAAAAAHLARLRAPYGVYAVVGNHEYYAGLEAWKRAFPRLGLHLLFNRHAVIPVKNSRLVLAGLTDRVTLRGQPGEKPDLGKALAGAPEKDGGTMRIVLDHQPSGARENAAHGLDAQLSGHTHGGLALFLRQLVAPFNGGFVSGQYDVNGMRLIVSNGTALWAGMPLRLGVPGQILILRLVPAEQGDGL